MHGIIPLLIDLANSNKKKPYSIPFFKDDKQIGIATITKDGVAKCEITDPATKSTLKAKITSKFIISVGFHVDVDP